MPKSDWTCPACEQSVKSTETECTRCGCPFDADGIEIRRKWKAYRDAQAGPRLILDSDLSTALLIEAMKEKWVVPTDEQLKLKTADRKAIVRGVLQTNRVGGYGKKALELAALHHTVALSGVPGLELFDLSRLSKDQIVSGAIGAGRVPSDVGWDKDFIESRLLPLTKYVQQRGNWHLRTVELSGDFSSGEAAIIIKLILSALDLNGVYDGHKLFLLYHALSNALYNKQLTHEQNLLYVSFCRLLVGAAERLKRSLVCITLFCWETLGIILNLIMLDGVSVHFQIPYASSAHSLPTEHVLESELTSDRVHHTYKLCCISMNELIRYAPTIDNIHDLMRIREDKRVAAFRSTLQNWAAHLPGGEARLIAEIKKEIKKRNTELRRLEKWKAVDRWFYYTALPAGFIPIISEIHNVAGVGLRFYIEKRERSNWLALGR
jgi:transcription initiation factor TFIIIB Brf1 subunit/transcription initiation factor TFIIB